MGKTSIEWTDHSLNPIRARLGDRVGHHCVKVSPGCANCYSSRMQRRFGMPEFRADLRRDVRVYLDDSRSSGLPPEREALCGALGRVGPARKEAVSPESFDSRNSGGPGVEQGFLAAPGPTVSR